MADSPELTALHRTLERLRADVSAVRERYGEPPAVRRVIGDLDRLELDSGDLEGLVPVTVGASVGPTGPTAPMTVIDDRPPDPSLWAGCDDEGLGGYLR